MNYVHVFSSDGYWVAMASYLILNDRQDFATWYDEVNAWRSRYPADLLIKMPDTFILK